MDRNSRRGRGALGSPSQHRKRISQHLQNLKRLSVGDSIQNPVTLQEPRFCAPHFSLEEEDIEKEEPLEWRVKTRMKTGYVALVMAMNIGIDPPNNPKTSPCARMECWIDPMEKPAQESLRIIGKSLQSQYERWQPRARYKQCLDPTLEEIKKVCLSMRRNAKRERILFHYNGRGVPFPTNNSEIWVFNKNYTQYIPLSIYDLDTWVGNPAIYVFDCCKAETILKWFVRAEVQKKMEAKRKAANDPNASDNARDVIVLSACGEKDLLPTNPDLPADIFTACLTTPIKMALRWFCLRTALTGIDIDLIDAIPGTVSDRRTPLGELNWIFTAITDTIAWNVLPHHLFQKLFRQDLLVASLMRNYLLAERIMRAHGCTPVSLPSLPPTYQHPLWRAWDLAADICISQLPTLIKKPKLFQPNPFFSDQLTAFEIWLEFASQKGKQPPEQLPIVLQVLLSKQHRTKALELLARFLDLGPWAVNYALSVGIFPYVLKLLQSPVPELRKILASIWAKILALDLSCQADLLKDSGHVHFANSVITNASDSDLRAKSLFVLSCMVNNFRQGQAACLNHGLIGICMKNFNDPDTQVRKWSILTVAKLWEDYNEAKWVGIREKVHERLCLLLTDPVPEVRAAVIYALGTFFGGAGESEERQQIEKNLCLTLFVVSADMSPLARRELILSLCQFIFHHVDEFFGSVIDMARDELKIVQEMARRRDKRRIPSTARENLRSNSKTNLHGSVCGSIWKIILSMRYDPSPVCSKLAKKLVSAIYSHASILFGEDLSSPDPTKSEMVSHLLKRSYDQMIPSSPSQTRRRQQNILAPIRTGLRRSSGTVGNSLDPNPIPDVKPEFSPEVFHSTLYQWSFEQFNQPHGSLVDETSPELMERDWRLKRQAQYFEEIQLVKDSACRRKLDNQIALMNDNQTDVAALIELHPTEPLCIVADDKNMLSIWNWEESTKIRSFCNTNSASTRISCVSLANTQDQFMTLVGSSEGVIRIWKNLTSDKNPKLVTAWRALSDSHSSHQTRGSGLVFDWNQGNGHLMTSGNTPLIRVWDIERELSIQDIPTGTETTCVTSLKHQPGNSTNSLMVAGCGDGSLKLYDVRVAQKSGVTAQLDGHKGWVLNAAIPVGNIHTIASGDTSGEVKFWDCRAPSSPRVTYNVHRGEMTTFAIHDYADIFCTGTQNQKIRLASCRDGKEINSIRYHDGLILGQRIGPICSLAFHPYKLILAAGATDSIISMYRAN